ncbi:MAG: AAA family ATPase [Chloroflexi bacterium]|nr:AAA family ATPase [Chloroflexota bacterium]
MATRELEISGYRSIRDLRLMLGQINVLTGPNGCGKSNLYNAVFLLARAAEGSFARAIADEGGMPSVLWAGPEGKRLTRRAPPRRVCLAVTLDDFGYELQCGLPQSGPPGGSKFLFDPQIKEETVWLAGRTEADRGSETGGATRTTPPSSAGSRARRVTFVERADATASIRDANGRMVRCPLALYTTESVLSQIQEPHVYPELSLLRETLRRWRFYHHFRTDRDAPIRHPQVGVLTPVLGLDGADLAAALQTIREIGDDRALAEAVDRAFPGAKLEIGADQIRFQVLLRLPSVLRPLAAPELSDGTLRYLCLVAALLSPRPPALLALNEPETSLHPDLLAPLAQLVVRAARTSQLWITTHSRALADEIERLSGQPAVRLRLVDGETQVT